MCRRNRPFSVHAKTLYNHGFGISAQIVHFRYSDFTMNNNQNSLPIREAQQRVDEWIKTYGVRYYSELTNMAVLTEEVGELARIMARTYGDQSFKKSDLAKNLGDEMADVLFVLICLANQTGVDLEEAFRKNLEKKTERDAERHRNNPKLR
jgi:NTP pyrophosphatase (non-canonical NTP hydrolase)